MKKNILSIKIFRTDESFKIKMQYLRVFGAYQQGWWVAIAWSKIMLIEDFHTVSELCSKFFFDFS
jgi:hypothetical protein